MRQASNFPCPQAIGGKDVGHDTRQTMEAWENFLSGSGGQECSSVRPMIHASWERSVSSGVDWLGSDAPLYSEEEDIDLRRRHNADLLEAARIPFTQLGKLLDTARAMLVLTDRDGVILETIGDARTLDDGREIHLEIGGIWNETAAGTNGIGTALWTGEPVFVHAAEHFCAGIKGWTCAGAPVRDPIDDSVIGVVDLSGPTEIFRPHNTALITAAAREIEASLRSGHTIERARLLETCLKSGYGRQPHSGLIILDRLGRIVLSRNAPQVLPVDGVERRVAVGQRLAHTAEAASIDELSVALAGDPQLSTIDAIHIGGVLRGYVLEFAPASRTPCAIRRPMAPAAPARIARERSEMPAVIGKSAKLLETLAMTVKLARASVPLLLEGETGVGKELFARVAHAAAVDRPGGPFVVLDCNAPVREAFAQELFGGGPGMPPCQLNGRAGPVERAAGGTLCLDEIGEMPAEFQPYLLRLLEEASSRGEARGRPLDIRFIALTSRSLQTEVDEGRFRQDLYFRIGALPIRIPPLRERPEDLPPLLDHFNEGLATRLGTDPLHFTSAATDALAAYAWPGNVRELRNTLELLHLVRDTRTVEFDDLPDAIRLAESRRDPLGPCLCDGTRRAMTFKSAERQLIMDALAGEDGNVSRAATALGISRPTLYRKMQAFGIARRTAVETFE